MSIRKTGIYLICFLLLTGFYYVYEIRGKIEQAKMEKAKQEANRIFPFAAMEVQSLRILSSEAPTPIQLLKRGEEWSLIEPVEAEGNPEEIGKILEALGEVKIQRVVEENPSNLALFGLDNPILQVEVGLHDGQKFLLLFGNINPTGTAFYAKKADEQRVFLVALGFKYRLGKGVKALQAQEKKGNRALGEKET